VSGARRFAALRRSRHTVRSGPLRIAWVPPDSTDDAVPAVAYAIGRRVGTAVVRNRLRRRLRAAMSEARPAAGDYLVHAGPAAAVVPYADLKVLVSQAIDALAPTGTSPR
jgi:ribonuclease P protein component